MIQVDCPEDVNQYIHRAGRTARHNAKGESLLVLMPSEEDAMIEELKQKNIQINRIHIDPKKMFSPKAKIEAFLAQDQQLKETAKRAYTSYIKSVFLMKNKNIFKVNEIDFESFSKSLGLVSIPRIRFVDRIRFSRSNQNSTKAEGPKEPSDDSSDASDSPDEDSKSSEEADSQEEESDSEEEDSQEDSDDESLQNQEIKPESGFDLESNSEDEDLFKIKRRNHEIEHCSDSDSKTEETTKGPAKQKVLTKAAIARRVLKKKIVTNKKVLFNEEGQEVRESNRELQSELGKEYMTQNGNGIDIEMAKKVLQEEDKFDRKRHKELVKSRKIKAKSKLKDFEGDNDFDSESENDVDLSWLPDPDKVYGSEKSVDSESSDDDEDQIHRPPSNLFVKNNKRKNSLDQTPVSSIKKKMKPLTLTEAEDIAMQLLQ